MYSCYTRALRHLVLSIDMLYIFGVIQYQRRLLALCFIQDEDKTSKLEVAVYNLQTNIIKGYALAFVFSQHTSLPSNWHGATEDK